MPSLPDGCQRDRAIGTTTTGSAVSGAVASPRSSRVAKVRTRKTDEARKRHVVNNEMILKYILDGTAPTVVISKWHLRKFCAVYRTNDPSKCPIIKALEKHYNAKRPLVIQKFGQYEDFGDGLFVYTKK